MRKAAHQLRTSESLTVRDVERFGGEWILDGEMRQLSRQTLDARRFLLGKLVWFLRQREYDACGTPEVRAFFAYINRAHETPEGRWGIPRLRFPVKPVTVETYFINLKTFFQFLVDEGRIEASPMETLKPPVYRPDQIQPFTEEQIQALLDAARKSRHPRRNEAILLFLLDTGCRVSELCGLQFRDLDMQNRKCRVLGKGNKHRTLCFGARTTRALWSYLRERETEDPLAPVFASDTGFKAGEALTRSGVFQLVQRLGVAARIEATRCSPHTFRHTFAVTFLRNGGNIFTLKELLGHTALTMVNRYVALAQADLEAQHRLYSPVDRIYKRAKG